MHHHAGAQEVVSVSQPRRTLYLAFAYLSPFYNNVDLSGERAAKFMVDVNMITEKRRYQRRCI
jgi:hypothetical protein